MPADPAANAAKPAKPEASADPASAGATTPAMKEVATFGSGCFWCTEAVLEQQPGVLDVKSGYMGGTVDNPTYREVCSGTTGHAEVVQVTFDPQRISYETLLGWFFRSHDPTTLDRQGADVGPQYRSAIFTHSPAQHDEAVAMIKRLQPEYGSQIVTEVTAAETFWPAEDYHQDYYKKNPGQGYCRVVIMPKLEKLGLKTAPK